MDTKNTPLTPEELRQMDGQPVWCVTGDGDEFWALVDVSKEDPYAVDKYGRVWPNYLYNSVGVGEYGLSFAGWLAYRRPPEEAGT